MMQVGLGQGTAPQNYGQSRQLTETQDEKLTELLSNYDSENLSGDDAKQIVEEIKELGIQPGAGLANALADAGIDARGLAEQAGITGGPGGAGGPPPPPPPGGGSGRESVDDTVVSLIASAMEAYEQSDDAENLWSVLETTLADAGYDTSQSLVDFYS